MVKILTMMALLLIPQLARGGHVVALTESGSTFTFVVDDKGRVLLEDLPLEGQYLFDSITGLLYVTQGETSWSVNTAALERKVTEAEMVSPSYADRSHVLGFNTRRWSLSARGKYCHMVDGSTQMADRLKLDMTDIARLNIALGYLTAQDLSADACVYHTVPRALAHLIGFPAKSGDTEDGLPFEVLAIHEKDELTEHPVPENAQPMTDGDYETYLKGLLNQQALSSYLRTASQLDSARLRVRALRTLLADPINRKVFQTQPVTASDLFDATDKAKSIVTTDLGR